MNCPLHSRQPVQAVGPMAHLTAVTRSFPWMVDGPELVSELIFCLEARYLYVGGAGASVGPKGLDLSAKSNSHDDALLPDSSLGLLIRQRMDLQ